MLLHYLKRLLVSQRCMCEPRERGGGGGGGGGGGVEYNNGYSGQVSFLAKMFCLVSGVPQEKY